MGLKSNPELTSSVCMCVHKDTKTHTHTQTHTLTTSEKYELTDADHMRRRLLRQMAKMPTSFFAGCTHRDTLVL